MLTLAITTIFAAIGGAFGLWLWCCFQLSAGLIGGGND